MIPGVITKDMAGWKIGMAQPDIQERKEGEVVDLRTLCFCIVKGNIGCCNYKGGEEKKFLEL